MSEPAQKAKRRGLAARLLFGGGKWYWMLLRLAIVVGLIVAFRWQVLAWVALGHNAIWKATTKSEGNHQGDVGFLLRLRGPGARALVRMGETEALASAHDPEMAPALAEIATTHAEPAVRRAALRGLAKVSDTEAAWAATGALAEADPSLRALAAHILGDKGDASHVPALRAAADRETDPEARHAMTLAIQALDAEPPAPDAPPPPEHIYKH